MMNKEELKNKLLIIKVFVNNEYLDQYCDLIVFNQNQEKLKYKTQAHHIIPKCYFVFNSLDIDNSKENLVNLFYKDHILAHYYLCLCTEGAIQFKLANAFFHLVARRWKYEDFDPEIDLSEYQDLYEIYCRGISEDKERYKKSSKSLKGIKRSQEFINKIKNIPRTDFVKNKISESRSVYMVQNLETGEIFQNASKASLKIINKETPSILDSAKKVFKGFDSTAYGFHWMILKKDQVPYNEEERMQILNNLIPPDYSRSEEMKQSQSKKMKDKKNRKGKTNSEEHKRKASKALKGKKRSEEDKQKMRKPRSHYNKTKEKDMSKISTPVRCIDNGKEFPSISEAIKWLKLNGLKGDVRACVAGNQKTAGGMRWEKLK